MAGKSKAERKKARTSRAKAKDANAPLQHQIEQKIEPVVPVMVKVKKVETTVNGRPVYKDAEKVEALRRKLDAELFDMVAEAICREDALMEIQGAWNRRTRGTGMSAFDPAKVRGMGNETSAIVDFNIDLERRYADWVRLCENREITWTVVTDYFCIGTSLRVIETTARKQTGHGWAQGEIMRAADVWCELRGWKKREKAA